jgi:predicted RecA/RadA family phage recombinase
MNYVLKTTDTLGFWSNLDGFFETKPPTDPSKLTFSNAAWSRPNSSSTLTITLPSASGDYLATGDLVGIYGVTNTAGSNVDSTFSGTYALTKTNATTYTITTAEAAAANGVSNGTALTLKKLDPWMSGVATTHSITGASGDGTTVTYTSNHLFSIGQRVTVTGVTPTAYNISNAIVTATTSTSFKILSNATATYTSGGSATLAVAQLEETKNYLPANTKIYYVIRLRHSATTTAAYNILVNQTGNPAGMFAITDVGQAKELTYAAQADNWKTGLPPGKVLTTVAGSTVTATLTLNADSSAYYDNYGKGDSGTGDPYANQNSIYQGNPGTASGTKRSAVRFPAITFVKETNLQITKVEVYLRNRHSYNSSGLTTKIGFHTASSLGSSIPTASNTTPVTTTFSKGQGKWVTLTSSPTSFLAGLVSAKTFRGIVISLTDNSPITYDSSLSNYGYFDGNTQSDEPKLRITYTYTE